MSAVLRWRCDVCGGESETSQKIETGVFAFFHPKAPEDWKRVNDGEFRRDICSQRCFVAHYEGIVYREQRKLADGGTPKGDVG